MGVKRFIHMKEKEWTELPHSLHDNVLGMESPRETGHNVKWHIFILKPQMEAKSQTGETITTSITDEISAECRI